MEANEDTTTDPTPRITAILNCYGPGGANVAQVIVRANGQCEHRGVETLAAGVIDSLRKRRGRPAKAF